MNKKLYQLMKWPDIETIVYSEESNPHKLLGVTMVGTQSLFQLFYPKAKSARVISLHSKKSYEMILVDEDGYFARLIPEADVHKYQYELTLQDGSMKTIFDPYQFERMIQQEDVDKFEAGIHYSIYKWLGAHKKTIHKIEGILFAVWAPNAVRVSVVGDFNEWDGRVHQMRRLDNSGIFEIFIPEAQVGDCYKFELKLKGSVTYLKADPYASAQQLRPETASIVHDSSSYKWDDNQWLDIRFKKDHQTVPISIYELHLASFCEPKKGEDFSNYRDLAPKIIAYVNEMGYTHIELMPIMEHPFDASWGYQVIGYYAPTSRYGSPEDFKFFINEMHKAEIGVILDWVPAHFPKDSQGLSNFDGTCLYEHVDPRKGEHPHWGTLIYNYKRPQVSNYLIANALYWAIEFHVDGIRMDAVASMLYLDYGREDGSWIANIYGGNENLEAIEFLKHLNSIMHKECRGVLTIAEESTAWPNMTGDLKDDGLGFDFKWNMGWMNDYLDYIKYDPYFRAHHHFELTFSMVYNYSEQFMLVFSHDEVVHGKSSMLGKMQGTIKEKFMNLRATYAYMMFHPGRKLLFMGQDIGEFDEWSETRSVQWGLLEHKDHNGLKEFVKTLNKLYKQYPALHLLDNRQDGFEWINSISANECVLIFLRKTKQKKDTLLIVCNFANMLYKNYKIGVPYVGKYKEILNSDHKSFGGDHIVNSRVKFSKEDECDDRANSIKITLAPLSVSVFDYRALDVTILEEETKKIDSKIKVSDKKTKVPYSKSKEIDTKVKATAHKSKVSDTKSKEIDTKVK